LKWLSSTLKVKTRQLRKGNRQVFASKNKAIWALHPDPEGAGFTAQKIKSRFKMAEQEYEAWVLKRKRT
jgi:hypothetical protein